MNTLGWSIVIALAYLPIAVLAPGFFIVRKWRLSPGEKLTASVAISVFLLYLAGFFGGGLFGSNLGAKIWAGACAVMALLAARDWRSLWRHPIAGASLKAAGAVVLFALLLDSMVIFPTGGDWGGDQWEHYQRSVVFMGLLPADTTFIGLYTLPARPPLMNAAAGAVLTLAPITEYCVYQAVYACLSALAFLGCVALAPRLVRKSRPNPWLIAAMLVCVPMFWQNCTFAWTKLLTAFFVLASLSFYLAALRKKSTLRKALAFGCAAAAILTHYSAVPYVLVLTAHYVAVHLKDWRRELPRAVALLALSVAMLATWFAYSLSHFGVKGTFASNTTVSGFVSSGDKIASALKNVYFSVVPFFLRGQPLPEQISAWGKLREFGFFFYQTSLPGLIGVASLAALFFFFLTARARTPLSVTPASAGPSETRFWMWLIPVAILVGILVHPPAETKFGVAHVCLIPLALVAVAAAAQALPTLSPSRRVLVALLLLADFLVGVLLHYQIQSLDVPYRIINGTAAFLDPWPFTALSERHLTQKYSRALPTFHDCVSGTKPIARLLIPLIGLAACVYVARGPRTARPALPPAEARR